MAKSIFEMLSNLHYQYRWYKSKILKVFNKSDSDSSNRVKNVPSKVLQALKKSGMKKDDDITEFWFSNRDIILSKEFNNTRDDEIMAFEASYRWHTPIGKACYDGLVLFIRDYKQRPLLQNSINKYNNRVRQLNIDEFTFEFEEKTYDLATFNRFLGLKFNDNKKDLSGIYLAGLELHSLNIQGVDFSYATLMSCNFTGCWLHELELDLALFKNCSFSGCEVKGKCSLRFTNLCDSQFAQMIITPDFCDQTMMFKKVPYLYLFLCVLDSVRNTFYHDFNNKYFRILSHASFLRCDTSKLITQDFRHFKSYVDWYQFTMFQFGTGRRLKSFGETLLFYLSVVATKSWSSYKVLATFGALIALFFATAFYSMPEGAFSKTYDGTFFTSLYYSIVTFTTLGYGDITPIAWYAKLAVIIEVILGYVTLGSFVFIVGHKVSDRY